MVSNSFNIKITEVNEQKELLDKSRNDSLKASVDNKNEKIKEQPAKGRHFSFLIPYNSFLENEEDNKGAKKKKIIKNKKKAADSAGPVADKEGQKQNSDQQKGGTTESDKPKVYKS